MQIDTGSSSVRKMMTPSRARNGFKNRFAGKRNMKKYYSKMLSTTWDGTVYKKIHVVSDMNVSSDEALMTIAWGTGGTSTSVRIFLTDQPEFTSYAAVFD